MKNAKKQTQFAVSLFYNVSEGLPNMTPERFNSFFLAHFIFRGPCRNFGTQMVQHRMKAIVRLAQAKAKAASDAAQRPAIWRSQRSCPCAEVRDLSNNDCASVAFLLRTRIQNLHVQTPHELLPRARWRKHLLHRCHGSKSMVLWILRRETSYKKGCRLQAH